MYAACIFLPLIASIITGLFSRIISARGAQLITSGALIISFLISLVVFNDVALEGNVHRVELLDWITSGSFQVAWALQFDTLTAEMVFVVTTVSAVFRIYGARSTYSTIHGLSVPVHFRHVDIGNL